MGCKGLQGQPGLYKPVSKIDNAKGWAPLRGFLRSRWPCVYSVTVTQKEKNKTKLGKCGEWLIQNRIASSSANTREGLTRRGLWRRGPERAVWRCEVSQKCRSSEKRMTTAPGKARECNAPEAGQRGQSALKTPIL